MKKAFLGLFTTIALLTSCISEEISFDSSSQPVFSVEQLTMAPLLSGQTSPTYRLKIFNPASKGILINSVTVDGNTSGVFRFNIDGLSGDSFEDITIRGGDSIYMFIDAHIPDTGSGPYTSKVLFNTAGQTKTLFIEAPVIEAQILESPIINSTSSWTGNYYIKGQAMVEKDSELIIGQGSGLFFAPGASLTVAGKLNMQGTLDLPVMAQGDRFDDIVPGVSYDMIGGQWKGITLQEDASLEASYSCILNTENTLIMAPGSSATLFNCQLHNASTAVITATEAAIVATGCEITDAAENVIALESSNAQFSQCTIANFYLLSYPTKPIISLTGDNIFDTSNSIVYGLAPELGIDSDIETRPIYFRRCLFASPGYDDANFIECIWDTSPELYIARTDYIFDYTPRPDSPAVGAANRLWTPIDWTVDRLGTNVESDTPIGCYGVLNNY